MFSMPGFSESTVIDVETGEVKVSCAQIVLCSRALGSCIAVIAYDPVKKIGGIAHVMLPGKADTLNDETNRYAENAIDDLLEQLRALDSKTSDIKISLVGGANLLGEGNINTLVKDSVLGYLKTLNIEHEVQRLGGTCARSVWLMINSGEVFFKEEDNEVKKLTKDESRY